MWCAFACKSLTKSIHSLRLGAPCRQPGACRLFRLNQLLLQSVACSASVDELCAYQLLRCTYQPFHVPSVGFCPVQAVQFPLPLLFSSTTTVAATNIAPAVTTLTSFHLFSPPSSPLESTRFPCLARAGNIPRPSRPARLKFTTLYCLLRLPRYPGLCRFTHTRAPPQASTHPPRAIPVAPAIAQYVLLTPQLSNRQARHAVWLGSSGPCILPIPSHPPPPPAATRPPRHLPSQQA